MRACTGHAVTLGHTPWVAASGWGMFYVGQTKTAKEKASHYGAGGRETTLDVPMYCPAAFFAQASTQPAISMANNTNGLSPI